MAGFAIAALTELATGKRVVAQLFDDVAAPAASAAAATSAHALDGAAFGGFVGVTVLVMLGSLAPLIVGDSGEEDAKRGVWTAQAELQNARAAMLGFVALLATEAVKGSAVF